MFVLQSAMQFGVTHKRIASIVATEHINGVNEDIVAKKRRQS
jgi:hypothetical protein